jgi:hypothetical protein
MTNYDEIFYQFNFATKLWATFTRKGLTTSFKDFCLMVNKDIFNNLEKNCKLCNALEYTTLDCATELILETKPLSFEDTVYFHLKKEISAIETHLNSVKNLLA